MRFVAKMTSNEIVWYNDLEVKKLDGNVWIDGDEQEARAMAEASAADNPLPEGYPDWELAELLERFPWEEAGADGNPYAHMAEPRFVL